MTDPRPVPSLLAAIGLGFILLCQAIAAQTGLGYRAMAQWLVAMIALTLGFGVLVLVTTAVGRSPRGAPLTVNGASSSGV